MVNILDLVILAVLAFFVVRGLFRGLFLEAASLAGLFLAFLLANKYYASAAPFFQRWLNGEEFRLVLAYGVIFLGVMFGVSIVARLIKAMLRANPLSWLEIPGGALLGLAKGLGLVLIALALLSAYAPEAKFVRESRAAEYLSPATGRILARLPDKMAGFDFSGILGNLDEDKKAALESFLNSNPESRRALHEYLQSDPERKKAFDEFLSADPEKRRAMLDKYTENQ